MQGICEAESRQLSLLECLRLDEYRLACFVRQHAEIVTIKPVMTALKMCSQGQCQTKAARMILGSIALSAGFPQKPTHLMLACHMWSNLHVE